MNDTLWKINNFQNINDFSTKTLGPCYHKMLPLNILFCSAFKNVFAFQKVQNWTKKKSLFM